MSHNAEAYGQGIMYEFFIRRAFNCDRGMRHGADVGFMRNLIDTENGASWMKGHRHSYEKQFATVSTYIGKALEKFLKQNLKEDERAKLTELSERLAVAASSVDLMAIVNEGLEATQRLKEMATRR